jgi:hypothetical protein
MPRKSAEARSAAYWRSGTKPPAAPKILSPSAAALWRKIVVTRPPDYFTPATLEMLAQFCEISITQRLNFERLRRDPLNTEIQRNVARLQQIINSTAVKLRLATSSSVDKKSGILDEREPDLSDDGDNVITDVLFGGPGRVKF